MKKIKLLSVLTLMFLLITLVGCNNFNSIKKDFEKAGYTYSEDVANEVANLLKEFEDEDIKVTPHLFTKGLNFPVVLEFSSSKEMKEQLESSQTLKGLLKDLDKSDYVRGNCLLIPIGFNQQDMVNAFLGIKTTK